MFRIAPVLLALVLSAGCAAAPLRPTAPLDHLPALRGDYFRTESQEVGRPFHIYVRLPDGYDPARAAAYPTVYLTDGDSLFPILAANHLFLTYDDDLPEAIVVGIAYGGFDPATNRRKVDFQTPGDGVAPDAAGAPAFQSFLKRELIPEIERRFHADPSRRVLFGQSRGGAFVLWSAVNEPDLFWGRIASNPSITPGVESLMGAAAPAVRDDLGVVLVSGTRDWPDLQAEAELWGSAWEARADRPWRLHRARVEGGTHAANAGDAYRIGMNWLFGRPAPP
ncbi:MAG: esterase family protein [Caulobacteraceae bacterium]|nr:esterase family protein [Caulobacteraceae bacterium]